MVNDAGHMRRALFHAGRAEGATAPNPMVGAVVVTTDGVVVGYGRHQRAGGPHAEVFALDEAGDRARGATLYVTLEPCCHTGRTPPCTRRIIAAGVARVVAAMTDPNPLVSGQGFEELRAAGIEVEVGVLEDDAARLNRPFLTVQTRGRPMVIAKVATSVDGRIAAAPGTRTRLTSRAADRRTQRLRAAVDAVAVGSGTVLADDPLLTVRGLYRRRPLTRVIFDRRLRIPATARLFSTLDAGPVIILTTAAAASGQPEKVDALIRAGAELVCGSGEVRDGLQRLPPLGISSVLLEGGATLHAAAWRAGAIDSVQLVAAPRALGDAGVKMFDGVDVPASALRPLRIELLAPDVWMEADVYGDR